MKLNARDFGRRVAEAMLPVDPDEPPARKPKIRRAKHRVLVGYTLGRWGHCGCSSCNGRSWKRDVIIDGRRRKRHRRTQYRVNEA